MKYQVKVLGNVTQASENDGYMSMYSSDPADAEQYIEEINMAIAADYEDLAQYIGCSDERAKKLQAVTSINQPTAVNPVMDKFSMVWVVETSRELTEDEQKALVDYIEGQSSDGWGEGFEQHPVHKYHSNEPMECEECSGRGCEYCDGTGRIDRDEVIKIYAHPIFMPTLVEECDIESEIKAL